MVAATNDAEAVVRRTKQNRHHHSRPQKNLWSFDLMLACLLILTLIFFVLTIYSILQSNLALLHLEATHWLLLRILDTSTSATLFVSLVGALLVRHQFALGLLPRLNYKSTIARKQDAQNPSEISETWRVEIRNTGLGSAIVNRIEYVLNTGDSKSEVHSYKFDDVVQALAKLSLMQNSDYWLENIAAGFSLSAKDECFVFEIRKEYIGKLRRFDMIVYFQGQLGDKYCKEISLIPRL